MEQSIVNRIRQLAEDLDIAETYPKHINITFDEANEYVIKRLKDVPLNASLVNVPYDQGLLNCLRGIQEKQVGLGKHILAIGVPKEFDHIAIKFDQPYGSLEK